MNTYPSCFICYKYSFWYTCRGLYMWLLTLASIMNF